jgi:hypothetical protein
MWMHRWTAKSSISDRRSLSKVLCFVLLTGGSCTPGADGGRVAGWWLETDLRIGSVDRPDYSFQEPLAAVIRDSMLFLTQWGTPSVFEYDARSGAFQGSIGRRGSGPGEFSQPTELGWLGDTLWVRDLSSRAIELFDPTGTFIGNISFSIPESGLLRSGAPILLLSSDLVWAEPSVDSRALEGDTVVRIPILAARPDGSIVDTMAFRELQDQSVSFSIGNAGGTGRNPLAVDNLLAYAPTQNGLVALTLTPDPGELIVSIISLQGDTLRKATLSVQPLQLTRRKWDVLIGDFFRQNRIAEQGISYAAFSAEMRDAIRSRDYLPAARRVLAERNGEIWIERGLLDDDSTAWLVLDRDLNEIGAFSLPFGTRLLLAQADFAWGVVHDANDVPFLQRFVVHRSDRLE